MGKNEFPGSASFACYGSVGATGATVTFRGAIVAAFEADGGEVILCHDPEPTEWDIR